MSFVGNEWLIKQIERNATEIENLIRNSRFELTNSQKEIICVNCEYIREYVYRLKLDESRNKK